MHFLLFPYYSIYVTRIHIPGGELDCKFKDYHLPFVDLEIGPLL